MIKATHALALLILAAIAAGTLAGCAASGSPVEEMRPQDVRTGMSQSQVDRLMGVPKKSCSIYERAGNGQSDRDTICFIKGKVDTIVTRRPAPGRADDISVEWGNPEQAPPPSPTATAPALGMGAAQVARLMGKPSMRAEYYSKGAGIYPGSDYYAVFRNGVVVKFGAGEYRCVHGLCTRLTPIGDE